MFNNQLVYFIQFFFAKITFLRNIKLNIWLHPEFA